MEFPKTTSSLGKYIIRAIPHILIIGLLLLALDGVYLSLIGRQFSQMIKSIQGTEIKINWISVLLCYVLLSSGLYYFIILSGRSTLEAFLLGIMVYGVYDTTNYATISKWKAHLAIIDTIWGGVLFASTKTIYLVLLNFWK